MGTRPACSTGTKRRHIRLSITFFISSMGRRLKPTRIPTQWAQVTPDWMTTALSRHHPDARVADVAILTVDDGTNRRARFGLSYASGSGPASVFLKAHAPGHRIVHLRNGKLYNDARLFAIGVAIPQVAHGLRGLARLHSRYWGLSRKTHPPLRWVKQTGAVMRPNCWKCIAMRSRYRVRNCLLSSRSGCSIVPHRRMALRQIAF